MKTLLRFIGNIYQTFIAFINPIENLAMAKASTSPTNHRKEVRNPIQNRQTKYNNQPKKEHSSPKPTIKQTTTTSIKLSDYEMLRKRTYRVDYDKMYHKLDYSFYPTVLMPKIGTIIKPPQKGRNGNIGVSEANFL